MILDEVKLHYINVCACYILFSKSALKLYCSFKVTEIQRQKINEEKEKQKQIEMQRYKNTVLVFSPLPVNLGGGVDPKIMKKLILNGSGFFFFINNRVCPFKKIITEFSPNLFST